MRAPGALETKVHRTGAQSAGSSAIASYCFAKPRNDSLASADSRCGGLGGETLSESKCPGHNTKPAEVSTSGAGSSAITSHCFAKPRSASLASADRPSGGLEAFFDNSYLQTMRLHVLALCMVAFRTLAAQHVIEARLVDGASSEPLPYATVLLNGKARGTITNAEGLVSADSRSQSRP